MFGVCRNVRTTCTDGSNNPTAGQRSGHHVCWFEQQNPPLDDRFWYACCPKNCPFPCTTRPVSAGAASTDNILALLCDTLGYSASVTQFTKPGDDWSKRLQVNATYYKGNYSVIFFLFVLYSIIANPFLLMSIFMLGGGWAFLLTARPRLEDGSLAPLSLGGRVLTGMEQKAGLGVRQPLFFCHCCGLCTSHIVLMVSKYKEHAAAKSARKM